MTNFGSPRLITPPREEEEIYPYRRVWRSIIIENGLLITLVMILFGITFVGFSFPQSLFLPMNIVIVLAPLVLWIAFSYLPEIRVQQPRRNLRLVLILSALVANAIGYPFIRDFLQVSDWLSLASAQDRIIGYTVSVGILQEFLKYFIIRMLVWPHELRNRYDSIAYGAATAVGYATVLNIQYILENLASPETVAIRVLGTVGMHMVGSVIVAYGLSELWFSIGNLFILPITLILAALVEGITIPLRSGFNNAELGLTISATRPLFSLAFTLIMSVGPMIAMFFLFNVAKSRDEQVVVGEG